MTYGVKHAWEDRVLFARRSITSLLYVILTVAMFTSTLLVGAVPVDSPSAGGYAIVASSYLGSAGFDDSVVGARILSDGTIVLAANLSADVARILNASQSTFDDGLRGGLVHLSPDGSRLLALAGLATEVRDMAIDARDNVYLAAGANGLLKVDLKTTCILWRKDFADCTRVDASPGGHLAVIADGNIHVFDLAGTQIGQAKGKGYTNDVCVDARSKTVVFCGFRNAHAFDGKRTYPVQICYIIGLNYDGSRKWTNYDWSTDRESDRFLNKPTNNMADTRADRCAIGRDKKLYVTFQVAGGNHIFRYNPKDIMQKALIVGGDKYHRFYNSRAEHKNFFARYEPATGEYLAGQQFCGRLSNNRANAVVTKEGDITADEQGRVYLVGKSAYGIPVNLFPDKSDYAGGGFILIMSADLKERLLCTRTCGGKGSPHAVATRMIDGRINVVFGGSDMVEGMFVKNAIQAEPVDVGTEKDDPKDAFFVVLNREQE
jgi:hypothetical protein